MSACDRFEREGLLQLERGLPLDEHFETCPDCLEARRAHDHLMREVAAMGSDLEPPPQWKARVWEGVEKGASRERWLSWARLLGLRAGPGERSGSLTRRLAPAAALVVLVIVSVVWLSWPAGEVSFSVDVSSAQGAVRRGDDAHPGDILQLQATTGDHRYAELRVYFNDNEVVLRCSTEAPCSRDGNSLEATFEMSSMGSYQPVLFLSDNPLPLPLEGLGGLDQDVGAALEAGASYELAERISVR